MKFILLPVALLITITASSQVQFNVFGGPQITTANYKINGVKQPTKMKYGFNLGVGAKVAFEDKLFFAPAAFYSMKGYKVNFNQFSFPPDATATDNSTTIHTFEIAGLLQYDFSHASDHFFIKGGPSLDFQLFGHEKFNTMTGASVDRAMKFSYGDYGHFSASMLVQLGYETGNGLMIYGQYTYGMSSINNADGGPMIRHRVYGIAVGKYLHKK